MTSNSAKLIFCESSFLPAYSHVIRTDIGDNFLTVLLLHFSKSNITTNRRNFCVKNKTNFTNKLRRANLNHLFSLHDADSAFNHFIKKLKLKFNKSFPYEPVNTTIKKPSRLTSGILKSIKTKNKLYNKTRKGPTLKPAYCRYKNNLIKILRAAKLDYNKTLLSMIRNNSSKLWSHIKSLITPKTNTSILLSSDTLNNFFTSIYLLASIYKPDNKHTINQKDTVQKSFYLHLTTCEELNVAMKGLSNSVAVGSEGLNPLIIKAILT